MRPRLTAAFYGGPGFSLYHACGSASRVPLAPHFHDEYLICAQLRGDEQCHVAGKLHEFRAGDVALINPLQVHTGNTEGEEIEYISLYVDAAWVQRLASQLDTPVRQPEFTVVRIANQPALVEEMCGLLAAVQHHDAAVLFPAEGTVDDPELDVPRRLAPPQLAPTGCASRPPVILSRSRLRSPAWSCTRSRSSRTCARRCSARAAGCRTARSRARSSTCASCRPARPRIKSASIGWPRSRSCRSSTSCGSSTRSSA
ncbi:MAG: AraC family ligand binding domain-containing protein [Deltaproteobacteria bacterium]|nr:AraC family ligand binding domain-containing protein [Deltaproteobacteria bacterium]